MNRSTPAPARVAAVLGTPGELADLPTLPGPDIIRSCELTGKILDYDSKADIGLIDAAYALAEKAHSTQRRENGDPYFSHPVAVADILAGYRLDVSSIATALLHDVVEDTSYKLQEIEARFGKEIAGLVDGVTKLTRLELQSDRTKQAENFRKLVLAMSRDIRVLLVKLADRLHNMRTLHFVRDPERRKRTSRETMEIYAPLAERIGMDAVKTELQTLSFTQLEPEAYETISARLNFLRGQGRGCHRRCAAGADSGLPRCRGRADRDHGAGKIALLDLGENASAECCVRAAFGHHGLPHRGGEQG